MSRHFISTQYASTKQWHSMSRHFISTQYASTKQWHSMSRHFTSTLCINKTMTLCQGILLPLFMHQQNNDIMSRHFISTQYASTKQWQYVKAFYFHSVCINKTMTVCQGFLLPLFMHQQNNDIVCQDILFPLSMHQQSNDIVCQGILFPLSMHQQNNDSMSRHFISTLYASTKQWHSMSRHFTSTVHQQNKLL
jgi:hypothetical protein